MAEGGGQTIERRANSAMRGRFYKFNKPALIEEDQRHEFKAHKALSAEEVPRSSKAKRSCTSVSRTICAFLNTGHGGTVYLGIHDGGIVHGLRLTNYQKDHLMLSLEDLMARYKPPVPQHMYDLRFVPVITDGDPQPATEKYVAGMNVAPD